MSATTAGVFQTYSQAGAVVRELELIGISGAQVEVVSDAGNDVRGEGYVPAPKRNSEPNPDMTMVIVHPGDHLAVEQAKEVMQRHGAKVWQVLSGAFQPPLPPKPAEPSSEGSRGPGIGGPGTTGNDSTDLEGRGKEFDVHAPGAPGERETTPPRDPDHLPV